MIVRLSLSHTGVCSALCRAVWSDGYGGLFRIMGVFSLTWRVAGLSHSHVVIANENTHCAVSSVCSVRRMLPFVVYNSCVVYN